MEISDQRLTAIITFRNREPELQNICRELLIRRRAMKKLNGTYGGSEDALICAEAELIAEGVLKV